MLVPFQGFSKEVSGQTPFGSYWSSLKGQAGVAGLGVLPALSHRSSAVFLYFCTCDVSTLLCTLGDKPLNPLRCPSLSKRLRGHHFLCLPMQLAESPRGGD